jgi:hypothetical protein
VNHNFDGSPLSAFEDTFVFWRRLLVAVVLGACLAGCAARPAPAPRGSTTRAARLRHLEDFPLRRDVTLEEFVALAGAPDRTAGFGEPCHIYNLVNDDVLWLAFYQQQPRLLDNAFVRDATGKIRYWIRFD